MLKQYIAHFRALPVYYELGSVKTVDISTVTFAENKAAALQQVTVSEQLELGRKGRYYYVENNQKYD